MIKTRLAAVVLAAMLLFSCAAVFAETAPESEICTYTVYNVTGETVTELYLTDNASGEKSENYAGEKGLANQGVVAMHGRNYEGYEVTLSFKTESGREASFATLHFEDAPISLLAESPDTDATTGATPIAFAVPDIGAEYTLVNQTGEKITSITITENVSGTELPVDSQEMDPDAEQKVAFLWPADKTDADHFSITLKFVTESGYEASFTTLHFETVKINLLAPDALTGPTPISFGF